MILVTGATGNVGATVIAELTAKREPVRAFVRDEKRARECLGASVELARGHFEDTASIARALDGVDAVFLSSADQPNKVAHELRAHFEHLFPLLRSGALAQPTDTVRAVTGREPRSFATWARDYAAAFRV